LGRVARKWACLGHQLQRSVATEPPPVSSRPYAGERDRVRGERSVVRNHHPFEKSPLTPALSPEYGGEGESFPASAPRTPDDARAPRRSWRAEASSPGLFGWCYTGVSSWPCVTRACAPG